MSQADHVSAAKQVNVGFDGKCVSRAVLLADGTRKSVGVIFPSRLVLDADAPGRKEINAGRCRVRLNGESQWREYGAGERFSEPDSGSFDIETIELLDYARQFGSGGIALPFAVSSWEGKPCRHSTSSPR